MSNAARTFWSMYFLNLLKRENMISQEEYTELTRDSQNFPLCSGPAAEYNSSINRSFREGGGA